MKNIALAAEKRLSVPAARLIGRFFLTFLLSASRVFGSYTPFGLAMVAASGPKLPGLCALLGAGAGAFLFLPFAAALRYTASAILIYSASLAFFDTKFFDKPLFRPLVAAFWMLAVEAVSLLGQADAAAITACLCAAVCTAAATHYFGQLFSQERGSSPWQIALLFLLTALAMAAAPVTLGGVFSVGRAVSALLTVLAAALFPPATGAAVGVCTGLAMDLVKNSGTLFFAVTYGLGGLLVSLCRNRPRPVCALLFLLPGSVLAFLFLPRDQIPLICEMALAALAYLLLPSRLLHGKRAESSADTEKEDPSRKQLEQSAQAFRELYDSFHSGTAPQPPENPSVLFDRAAEKVCRSCVLCSSCWQKNYNATYTAFNDATPLLLRRGRAMPADFPGYFSARCVHFPEFLTALNVELQAYLLRRQYRLRLQAARSQAQDQYAQLSDLLSSTARQQAAPAFAAEALVSYAIGSALCPKEGENICGDQLSAFESGSMLYLLLSDGMGSGEAAHREAAMTTRLLERFLKAGIDPAPSLKTLNSALALRGEDSGSFTTIDLLALHRENGDAALYKYGAAPSYLKRGTAVTRISGASLPAGLQESREPPDATRLLLTGGSFFIMVSDGVADTENDEWLQNLLTGWSGTDPQTLASLILSEAKSRRSLEDDCAALVLYLPKSEQNGKKKV